MPDNKIEIVFKKADEIVNQNSELRMNLLKIGAVNEKVKELCRIVEDINSQEELTTITRA